MPLQLVRRERDWIVFNQAAFRAEVVHFFWGRGGLNPTREELYARSGNSPSGNEIDLLDTHWALARTAVAARRNLYTSMLPEARRRLEALADSPPQIRPNWVPTGVWAEFQRAGDGIHVYNNRSGLRTNIYLVKRDGMLWGGYAEAPVDQAVLRGQYNQIEPSLWQRMTGRETAMQARIRWLADINAGWNRFMKLQIRSGIGPREAQRNYRDAVHQAYLRAFIPLIGGSVAASPAGETVGRAFR